LLPVGWGQLGAELAREQTDMQRAAGGTGSAGTRVLIVGMDRDFIASEAAFYHAPRPAGAASATGVHLFDKVSLMYAYWFPAPEQEGATLIMCSFERQWLDSRAVRRHCATLEPVRAHTITVDGKQVCNYYTRVASGYHALASATPLPSERRPSRKDPPF
jgi:hypothetical protein